MALSPLAADEAANAEQRREVWRLLLAAAVAARSGSPAAEKAPVELTAARAGKAAQALLDLYAPLATAGPARPLTVAHLGQSLDGHIATASGDSYYITGQDNVVHLHRLRALCAAVVVGAGTVARDDPQLTVRHVEGTSPVRVVLDPRGRLDGRYRVFTDSSVPTLVVHAADLNVPAPGCAEVVRVPVVSGRLRLDVLLGELRARSLWSVFVEGGGVTVSSFVEAGLLDRLHVAVAPLITGRGCPGLTLAARDKIAECLRPRHRAFAMGDDVLFDCDLRKAAAPRAAPSDALARIV